MCANLLKIGLTEDLCIDHLRNTCNNTSTLISLRYFIIKPRILLAISGGIAAYKCADLVRLLVKHGAEVKVVMTRAAQEFITPLTLQALSGAPVHTELFSAEQEAQAMGHIALARWADMLLIAPATAHVIAKLSHGLADDLLSTLYLVAECPVFIAPAMNQAMWHKSITQENIRRLQAHGVTIIGPEAGEQACGDVGLGRMSEPDSICNRIFARTEGCLVGKNILITAGPTREAIDPVRYISNRSSGKMGYALANAALSAGAQQVTLISGPVNLSTAPGITVHLVESASQMYSKVMEQVAHCDIFIAAAAVADYTPQVTEARKIKKLQTETVLGLQKTQDILAAVANLPKRPFTVGFAAETDDLEKHALEKLHKKNLDVIAANWVGRAQGGFDQDENALQVFWHSGSQSFAMMPKAELAQHLIKLIAEKFNDATAPNEDST